MASRLCDIRSPRQLKGMSGQELRELAEEIREKIIDTVSQTGGHLASSLGVVELTLALHYVLDSPRDKIVWDVGHQCYAHKLLTGRSEGFCQLRQHGGLSGFTLRAESEHDCFGAGHGSTSISAALGLAKARDLRKSDEHIVAVIGDGALTGGLAFEGMNQAGDLGANLTVVLNDNDMSIAGNVGALSSHLAMVRANVTPAMRHAREEVARVLERLPMGQSLVLAMDRFRDGVKGLVIQEMLFENLGFTCLGPIDGHNLEDLIQILTQAVRLPGPVLVHAVTRKGKGYEPAEKSPRKFHSAAPFDPKSGVARAKSAGRSYSSVFGDALVQMGERDESVVAITAAMLDGTGIERFNRRFPHRTFDVGLCEEHAVTFAAGLAAAGMRPVVAVYSTFLQRAYDQIVHDVCLQNLPVVFALDRAGLVGDDGPTHHGVFDLSYLRHIPNLTVMAPADEAELRDMLFTALALDGPAAIRYPRGAGGGGDLAREMMRLEPGRAELLREGGDVALLAIGTMVQAARGAAEKLSAEGIEAAVVNARFVKPLDGETIASLAQSTGRIVTIEENVLAGGFGSAVLELLDQRGLSGTPLRRLGIGDCFVPAGEKSILLAEWGLDVEGVCAAARELCGGAPGQLEPAHGREIRSLVTDA